MTRSVALAGVLALMSSAAVAQTPPPVPALATRPGHEFNVSVQHYNYTEPPPADISIHGPKFGGEYTGTFALGQSHRWFGQLNVRGTGAIARYDGNCRPWQIVPSSTSPNGYRLTLGATSPCSETGDADWFAEGRGLVGRDFSGRTWGVSPFAGVGLRHLSNGTTGNFNFRTDEYLYVPVGMTVRTNAVANHPLAVSVEYDQLLRGWQKTSESLLTGGTVPASSSAPAFSIGDFTDLSFAQHHGWAFRASAAYQLNHAWSVEPYYVRWRVGSSPLDDGSVAFTVNGITSRQTFSYYEPLNYTHEAGVKVALHLGGK